MQIPFSTNDVDAMQNSMIQTLHYGNENANLQSSDANICKCNYDQKISATPIILPKNSPSLGGLNI